MSNQDLLELSIKVESSSELRSDLVLRSSESLLREMRSADLISASWKVSEASPVGAKALGAISVGSLLVAAFSAAVPKLIDILVSWIRRSRDDGISIVIDGPNGERLLKIDSRALARSEVKDLVGRLMSGLEETPEE